MHLDLSAVQTTTIEIAQQAGEVIMHYYAKPRQETIKSTFADIVTEGDPATEAVIVEALQKHFPDHRIVGEEGGGYGPPAEEATYTWYIDPIDGTTNYASRLPYFAASIALTDHTGQPLVGVVYNPVHDEMYAASKGGGTTLNGKPLHVSEVDKLHNAVLATGFAADKSTNPDNNLPEWAAFMVQTRDMRRFGSAALECCYVASGHLDGTWQRVKAWDCPAGILCVTEAGGKVTDYSGQNSAKIRTGEEILASNGLIHDQIVAVLGEVRQ
jgi:myo-inositol-1(or 4)-monophosphatase